MKSGQFESDAIRLEYAPAPPPYRPLIHLALGLLVLASGGVIGAWIGRMLTAPVYTTTSLLQVTTPATAPSTAIVAAQNSAAATIANPQFKASVHSSLQATKAYPSLSGQSTNSFASRITVAIVPDTKLIVVAYTDHDPQLVAAVVNSIASSAAKSSAVSVVTTAPVPSVPRASSMLMVLGGILGGVAGATGLAVISKRRQNRPRAL